MASIAGTTVRWPLSPRLIEVPNTETTLSARDAQDTLLDLEDNVEGVVWPKTRKMTGGEDLDGGVSVGFTFQYQNAKIVPQRTASASSGTVTTGSATQLIDSAADFVTDGVDSGDWIINFTDQSVTEVLERIDLNTLSVRDLSDGTDNQFDIGDVYKVWHVEEFTLTGGNHVAVDELAASINPMFPTFGRFCTRTSSSSATATSQSALEAALFFEGVIIDEVNGVAGTGDVGGVPIGTRALPSNNAVDALTIAKDRGVRTFTLASDVTLTSGDYSDGYTWVGTRRNIELTTVLAVNLTNNIFESLIFYGESDGNNRFQYCEFGLASKFSGYLENCGLFYSYELLGDTRIINCYSLINGNGSSIIDCSGYELTVRNYRGSLTVAGHTAGTSSVEIHDGGLIVNNTNTGGAIYARGTPTLLTDNSVGQIVLDQTESVKVNDIKDALYNRRVHDNVLDEITLYEADNITPKQVWDADDELTEITPQ